MSDAVLYETTGHTGIITLNRGDNRNSMTPEVLDAFAAITREVIATPPRCVIITGTGSCFSAGADFKSVTQRTSDGRLPHEASFAMYEPFLSVLDIPVPVIGALNGHAVGGGFGLALVCDVRIGNRESKYGANFAKLGISPGLGISVTLPRAVGEARAAEMLYTGRLVRGDEAAAIGLLSEALAPADVANRARELAADIAASAPQAIRFTVELLRGSLPGRVRSAARDEAVRQSVTLASKDAAEGIAALLAKRPPVFTG